MRKKLWQETRKKSLGPWIAWTISVSVILLIALLVVHGRLQDKASADGATKTEHPSADTAQHTAERPVPVRKMRLVPVTHRVAPPQINL
jgi:hypothetical protein